MTGARVIGTDSGAGDARRIYSRVSTVAGQSPEVQLDVPREYVARRGLEIAAEFVDHGVSGARDHRHAGGNARSFDVVLVSRVDRFARGVRRLVTVLDELLALGVELVSYSESLAREGAARRSDDLGTKSTSRACSGAEGRGPHASHRERDWRVAHSGHARSARARARGLKDRAFEAARART